MTKIETVGTYLKSNLSPKYDNGLLEINVLSNVYFLNFFSKLTTQLFNIKYF